MSDMDTPSWVIDLSRKMGELTSTVKEALEGHDDHERRLRLIEGDYVRKQDLDDAIKPLGEKFDQLDSKIDRLGGDVSQLRTDFDSSRHTKLRAWIRNTLIAIGSAALSAIAYTIIPIIIQHL